MINIPCPQCGCQTCDATTNSGEPVEIRICNCNDGSGNYDVTITPKNGGPSSYHTYRCPKFEIESCLTSSFNINMNSINHYCH
jgi:hypothetical protein